jgi:hypothetical protein
MLQSRLMTVVDEATLATIGAVIVGFGIAALVFRIQREIQQIDAGKTAWIPWADRLLIGVVTVTLLLVVFPIALGGGTSRLWVAGRLPAAACSGSIVALTGYIPALLAHYRLALYPDSRRKWIWFGGELSEYRHAGGSYSACVAGGA